MCDLAAAVGSPTVDRLVSESKVPERFKFVELSIDLDAQGGLALGPDEEATF